MWTESSSVNAVNLVKKSATIPEISFSWGITLLVCPVCFVLLIKMTTLSFSVDVKILCLKVFYVISIVVVNCVD